MTVKTPGWSPSAQVRVSPSTPMRAPQARSSEVSAPLPNQVTAMAGVIRPGKLGTVRLLVDHAGARLVPVGVSLNVPRPDDDANSLIERLLSRAASMPLLTSLPDPTDLAELGGGPS